MACRTTTPPMVATGLLSDTWFFPFRFVDPTAGKKLPRQTGFGASLKTRNSPVIGVFARNVLPLHWRFANYGVHLVIEYPQPIDE